MGLFLCEIWRSGLWLVGNRNGGWVFGNRNRNRNRNRYRYRSSRAQKRPGLQLFFASRGLFRDGGSSKRYLSK
jgi:hypothetical protein